MRLIRALPALLLAAATSACGGAAADGPTTLRLGYFPNLTHASAVYGVASGTYSRELGATTLSPFTFNAGPPVVEALFAGSLDAAYVGPGPTVNAFLRSNGAVVVVAGATSGGASLVVRPGVTDLRGRTIADPQTGGTQDVALRTYLAGQGLHVDRQGGGDVTVLAQDNAATLDLFKSGAIDGAWLPEPWASRLVLEAGGTVLVDERSLWPEGRFVTANLLVRRDFLAKHPDAVEGLIRAQVAAARQIAADPARAKTVLNDAFERLTGKRLGPAVLDRALSQLTLTHDPLAGTLRTIAEHAFATGLVEQGDLTGIYDLELLRRVTGQPVSDAGLGGG